MIGSLRTTGWSAGSSVQRVKTWTLDRNFDQTEGERLLNARNFPAAEVYLAKAVIDAEMRKRSASKRVTLRLTLAEAQRKQCYSDALETNLGKLIAAEATVRSAIEIAAANADRDLYIQCLDTLAEIFSDQGNFAAVEKVMVEAIKLEASLSRPDPLCMGRRVLRLGVARHRLGRLDEAIPALEKAVAIHEQTCGEDHEETAHHLTELGAALRARGDHAEAQKVLRRALEIHERQGTDSPAAIRDLHHLAGSLEESGDLEGAAAEYERALAYKHRVIGSNLDDLAELQYGLASLYLEWQNYSRARELLYEAIGTFRRHAGLRLCVAYETMAYIEECSGRYSDAVKELTLAGKVWEQIAPPRTRELIRNMERRAELLEMIRKRSEAEHLRERIERLQTILGEERKAGALEEPELAEWPLEDVSDEGQAEGKSEQLEAMSEAVGESVFCDPADSQGASDADRQSQFANAAESDFQDSADPQSSDEQPRISLPRVSF